MRVVLLPAVLASALLAAPAGALPIVLDVDEVASQVTASIAAPFPSAPQAIAVSGSLMLEMEVVVDPFDGPLASAVSSQGSTIALSDATYVLSTPPGVSLSVSGTGVGADLQGPTATGLPFGPGTSLFDVFGYTLSLNTGMLTGVGDSFGNPLDFAADLGLAPLDFVYPLNSVAQMVLVDLGGGAFDVALTLPFDAQVTLAPGGVETALALQGQVVLTGSAVVPEPATGLLLTAGLAALALRRRALPGVRAAVSGAQTGL